MTLPGADCFMSVNPLSCLQHYESTAVNPRLKPTPASPCLRSRGLFNYRLAPPWAFTTAALCIALFPLVDPIIYTPWSGFASQLSSCLVDQGDIQACLGGPSGGTIGGDPGLSPVTLLPSTFDQAVVSTSTSSSASPMSYKETLLSCMRSSDYASLVLHFTASCVIGPIWEEVNVEIPHKGAS